MMDAIEKKIYGRKKILEEILENLQSYIYTAVIMMNETIANGGSIFLFGNGKNILNIRYFISCFNDEKNVHAVSLCEDVVSITDVANEFGIDRIFDKQIELKAKSGDMLIGFSASGASKNVLRALSLGRNLGCKTIGFSGCEGGAMDEFCDLNLVVPSCDSDEIREMHLIIGNILLSFNSGLSQNNT